MKKRLLMLLSLFMAVTSVGWVHAQGATVSTVEGLQEAIAAEKSPIKLSATTFELSEQLVINKPITIQGTTGTIIIAKDGNWPGDNSKKNLISIEGQETGTVTLQNLCIKGSKASGINAQSAMKTILTNVTLEGNTNAGLLVHSEVEAKGLITKLNGWGGVNVDKGSPEYTPSFTFDVASTFEEESKIWSELKDLESAVKAPTGWYSYLGVQGTSTEEKRYWMTSKLTVTDNVKILNDNCKAVFGNGSSITVEGVETDKIKISIDDNANDYLILSEDDHPAIFGGKNGGAVEGNTKVTLKSGLVYYVFGGGYGVSSDKAANVSGTASINIEGGKVSKHVYGGSFGYGKIENVKTTVSGESTKITRLCAGGAAPVSGNSLQTVYEKALNAVKNVSISIKDATFGEGFGCGGGYSYAYTGMSTVTVTGAKLPCFYGVLANGYADNIKATLDGCTFIDGGFREIGAINRGKIKDASFSFNSCKFDKLSNSEVIPTVSLGAIEGWGNSDTNGDPVPSVTGSVAFTFTGCTGTPDMVIGEGLENANVTLTGAKAVLKHYYRGSNIVEAKGKKYMDAFKIADGKTWIFNNGFEINQPEESVNATVTLTNNGTLNVGVSTAAMVQDALTAGANQINLAATEFKLSSNLEITKPIALVGTVGAENAMTTFTQTGQAGSATAGDNLITIKGVDGPVSLENIKITKSDNYGLHVFGSSDVKLTNVTLSENKAGGLLVNGSTVTADKLTTEKNAWGGIEVAKGVGVTTDPKLTISNSTINEDSQIWADTDPSVEGSEKVAEWVAGTGWNMFTAKKEDSKLQTFWSQKTKIQINVTKSTFFYDEKQSNNKYTVQYTTTPADVKDIKVTYYDIKNGKPDGDGTTDGKSEIGSYYVIFTRDADKTYLALNDTVTMSINAKGVPSVSTKPTYTTVEAGQPLSMSLLEGGKAIVKVEGNNDKEVMGTFAWADANMILKEGEHNYAVVFTPANLAEMEVAIDSVKIKAKRYFTVTTGVSANGKATIDGKSASNRYVKDTTLNFVITPETGYEFTGWNGTNNKAASYKYKVEKDTSFVAGFAKKKFTVTVTDPGNNNTLTVKYKGANGNDQFISSRATLDYGTVLTVTATAAESFNAEAITSTGSTLSKGQIFLDANTTISATFVAKPEKPKTVAVTAPEGGTIRLTDKATGKEIVAGSSVKSGTTIIIERTPNKGYKLTDATQARTEQTVSENVTITAFFVKEVYTIKQKTGDGYTLTVDKTEGNYGDQVTVGYAVNAGYKAVALMVNAKEVPNNSTFTLTENTTVQAIVKEKATIDVNKDDQSYVYNGHNQPFVVKTTPAGLDSVSVSYTKGGTTVSTPVDAGTYTVHINRPEDENFKALNETATLEITKAPIVITARPKDADSKGEASVAGAWSKGEKPGDAVPPMTKALKNTSEVAIFTPTSSNYAVGYCTPGDQMNMKVSIIQPTEGGTITVWDGNLQIDGSASSNNNALKNTELRVIATPAEGYKFSTWTSGITGNMSDASATITSSKDITFNATFVDKVTLSPSITENASAEYDGTVKGGNLKITANTSVTTGNTSVTTGWSYSFQQNEMTVVPVNAGKYDVVVTRAADADCKACRVVLTNAFEIKKATPTITATPAATVAKGAMLYSAEVTGGAASTDGTFVWKSADEAINADATKEMIFVPSDKDNFKEVKVTGVEVKTTNLQVISFVQPENGTITVKRGETVLASGDPIAEGDELTITATAASGYELESLKVADKTFTNGSTYEVVGDATVNVVATMKKTQGGGGDPVVPVSVSSVSLDKSALTLPRLESYTLIATVNPSNATNKSVTWKSSDESIAKVDANGKVTAVKIGKATITVTTVDGNKTATCLVTVDFATGIEEMLAQTEVYSQQGNIIVNPVQPLQLTIVNMTGQTVYNDYISGSTQIPARSGVYIVKLSNAGNTIISKLIVR